MLALFFIWLLITGVSLAIALVLSWFLSPRTVGVLYIIVAIAFGGACITNILNGVSQLEQLWYAFMIVLTFFYLGVRFIVEFPEY